MTKSFMMVVDDRSAATLVPIIQTYIRPGTLIISDEWRAYSTLSTLGYTHQTVNHSQNFVNPTTGAHTNSVEGYWSCVKRQMRRQGVMNTSSDLFPTYLLESLWRKRFSGQDLFEKIVVHSMQRECYTLLCRTSTLDAVLYYNGFPNSLCRPCYSP